jgi:hypothetical protein
MAKITKEENISNGIGDLLKSDPFSNKSSGITSRHLRRAALRLNKDI